MFRKVLKFGLASTTGLVAASFIFPDQFTPIRKVINVGTAGVQIYWVYKYTDHQIHDKNTQAAQYLRDALRKNGGLYLKLGQLIATLDVIVPDEYRKIMMTLTRDCPQSSYNQVKLTIEQETGMKVEDIFSQFDKKPISSASIGQVHKGRLKTGEQVAVKIQHRYLSKNNEYDFKLMRFFVGIANWAFVDFKYNWLLQEFQKNITFELDFRHEAKNIQKIGNIIKKQKMKKISVPKVYLPNSRKLLIMEYIHGYHIDEIQNMKANHLNLKQIGRLFSQLMVGMIHRYGFVHGDPHGGNLKVRKDKNNQQQLVILDHGLYQVLSDDLRRSYNRFWLGLILNDEKIYGPAAKQLGAKDPKVLCSMLTSKSPEQLDDPKRKIFDLNPSSDRATILKNAQKHQTKIVDTLNQLNRDILLILKVNEFTRSIENMLGGRPFGVYEDIAKECVNSLELNWAQKLMLYWRMWRASK